jgi:hypothetical protein
LSEGEHGLEAEAADVANNIGTTSYTWIIDLTAPTSTIDSLETEYSATGFAVSWSGGDLGAATTSGIGNFDVDYKFNDGEWQSWLAETASTTEIFNFTVNPGDKIYFQARARDKASNLGAWSETAQTKISSLIAPPPILPTTNHIVISEIQISGETANDEFVELYNPTNAAVNLKEWKLKKKTSSGTESNLLTSFPDINLSAYSYFLIAHPTGYKGAVAADAVYSSASYAIASNNSLILYDHNNAVIDKLGFGTASDFEGAVFATNPAAAQSLERKAIASSTSESMASGGEDEFLGNGFDADDNSTDFILRDISDPQNLSSAKEPS